MIRNIISIVAVLLCSILVAVASINSQPVSIPVPSHVHEQYIPETKLLWGVLAFLATNAIVVLGGAVFIGRRLERMDDHSGAIEQHTSELLAIGKTQIKILESIARIETKLEISGGGGVKSTGG